MADPGHQQRGPDRRRQPRGGRRPSDVLGYAPLVFVIDARPSGRDACDAILAKLRFAVAPFETIEQAIRVADALRPDIVLVAGDKLDELRRALAWNGELRVIPIVAIPEHDIEATALIDTIRGALSRAPERHATV